MKDKYLFDLAKKLIEIREEAKKLGMFTDDRELLECPKCGLWEDVDINGRLFTTFKDSPDEDMGLAFKEVGDDSFSCPNCEEVIAGLKEKI